MVKIKEQCKKKESVCTKHKIWTDQTTPLKHKIWTDKTTPL